MELQFKTDQLCIHCEKGFLFNVLSDDASPGNPEPLHYTCNNCGEKSDLWMFPMASIEITSTVRSFFTDYYPVHLTRDLHKNEVAKHAKPAKVTDFSPFKKGMVVLRQKNDNKDQQQEVNNGHHLMVKSPKQTTLPKIKSEWIERKDFSRPQRKNRFLRKGNNKGVATWIKNPEYTKWFALMDAKKGIHPTTIFSKTDKIICLAAKVCIPNTESIPTYYYIPIDAASKNKARIKKPLTNS